MQLRLQCKNSRDPKFHLAMPSRDESARKKNFLLQIFVTSTGPATACVLALNTVAPSVVGQQGV
jgi:hypothetical protein